MRRLVCGVCLALGVMLGGVAPAFAATPDWIAAQSSQCVQAVRATEHRYHLPAGLLMSIAMVESGRPVRSMADIEPYPWTIDADGQALFMDSKAAASMWVAMSHKWGGKFIDVGCMQVDLRLHPAAFASLDDAFDPLKNADYAARYLLQLKQEAGGDWNVAVGLYHSHTPALAADYRDRVARLGSGILHGVLKTEPLYKQAMRQGTLRIAFAGGGGMALPMRQPARRARRVDKCQAASLLNPLLHRPMQSPCGKKNR